MFPDTTYQSVEHWKSAENAGTSGSTLKRLDG
nr:MAG TPA: hypothetical protein [Caudoviricetes sp.]